MNAPSRYEFSGRKVFDLREALGLSREKLSTLLKVTQQTIYNWERGKTYPNAEILCRLAVHLGVTPHGLFVESVLAPGYSGVLKGGLGKESQEAPSESKADCPF